MKTLFWLSLLIILYTYIGYPLLIYILSRFYKKPLRGKYLYPNISILISAYNEERQIENKIRSLLSIDYPEQRIEVLIGSDGSDDKTDEIISKYTNDRIRLFRQEKRQGKPNMLNRLVKEAKGEILVFTDARQRLDINALKELVKHFSDPKVGSVSAALFYENETGETKTGEGIGMYWEYEKFIRKSESRMGSMLGATGALYAIRKELFPQLPNDLLLDDIYIPMKIVSRGYRAIFDKKAKVFDRIFQSPKDEFLRRVRTLAGNYQLFFYLRELFNPLKGKVSWQFFSHKFLRLVVPFLLMLIFISNAFILHNLFFKIFFSLQIIFYSLAILGLILKHKNTLVDVPYMFCVMNCAAIVGLYKLLTRKQNVLWQKAGEAT